MSEIIGSFVVLPCADSPDTGNQLRQALQLQRADASALGQSAVDTVERGFYTNTSGSRIALAPMIERSKEGTRSIKPEDPLPELPPPGQKVTRVQVANRSTLDAARRLAVQKKPSLALNFANGIHPGGGFRSGSRAQEEVLCRSSALYTTLAGDPMYESHRKRRRPDSTDWVILSPDVPVFRTDDGSDLNEPWLLSFISAAAPVATAIGQPLAGDLLQSRIRRVLTIAAVFGYEALVLGAWGCGAFGNDPYRTAEDFREAIKTDFRGQFSEIVFAITDWSPERRFLGPFRDEFLKLR
jgi:uncharacterized protein (TIGR02452 family)